MPNCKDDCHKGRKHKNLVRRFENNSNSANEESANNCKAASPNFLQPEAFCNHPSAAYREEEANRIRIDERSEHQQRDTSRDYDGEGPMSFLIQTDQTAESP
ncbi:hypothetical protein MCC01947_15790 [Bifidobacteriaceae bacterium MCC01947]|jgi:hypothetical protein|nr:hypothetical protein MCC01947_15790 [Bifidobacteriaceae bacterium MCC01947]GDZ02127.1 hypothetical protein MCC01941_13780 [Bifidobacteriaceae bacterium MCC01941]